MNFKFDLHHLMDPSNVILVYEGKFDQQVTKSVLLMAERNIDSLQEDPTVKRKVFNVIVECLQNIAKHGERLEDFDLENALPVFMIGREKDHYIISSGNTLLNDQIELLTEKIERINSLDKEGLKQLYKEIMRNNDISEKGGAGLGLVDMARKSGKKLEYDFRKLDKKFSYFSLQITIPQQSKKTTPL